MLPPRLIVGKGVLKKLTSLSCLRPLRWSSLKSGAAVGTVGNNSDHVYPKGFLLQNVKDIPEYDMTLFSLLHERTGAQFYYFDRNDKNCTFCVQFKTIPNDSTGVAHILEHLVLCGSKNFPCPEPFFKMLTRSMATFMNAMTGPDVTMYPFSTQNDRDFENLMRVYLDAVFFPNLEYLDFRQEGWRLDSKSRDETSQPQHDMKWIKKETKSIEFSGVVFNEMKGAMSQLPSLVDHKVRSMLLPSQTYSNNFGGDPLEIINLTHEQLRNFHSTYYHPSNSKFILYGNNYPVNRWLELIDNLVLNKFDKLEINSEIESETKWLEPKTQITYFQQQPFNESDPVAVENSKRQSLVNCSFLISDISDVYHVYCWNILSYLLTSGPSSPFHKALVQSGLGADFSPVTGFENDVKDCYFSIGAQCVDNEKPDEVIEVINKTIDQVIKEGFPQSRIDSVLHLIELNLKHQKSNFGINLVMGTVSKLNHNVDIPMYYSISQIFDRLRSDLKSDPQFLQNLVKNGLRDNKHRLNLIMKPDRNYLNKLQEFEDLKLENRLKSLDAKEKEQIFLESSALLQKQNLVNDPSSLPKLSISDIDPKIISHSSEVVTSFKNLPPTLINLQSTNGVCYFKALFSIQNLTEAEKEMLPFFCSVLTQLGADGLNFEQLREKIDLCSGGFSVSPNVEVHPQFLDQFEETLQISSFCLLRNVDKMLDLWKRILTGADFNAKDYLKVILKERSERLQLSMEHSAHNYAVKSACAPLNIVSYYSELYSGVTHVMKSRDVATKLDIDNYVQVFQNILTKVFGSSQNSRCSLNIPKGTQTECLQSLSSLFANLTFKNDRKLDSLTHMWKSGDLPNFSKHIKYKFPYQVSYSGLAVPAVSYCHRDFSPLGVLTKLLSWNYLHQEIREKGGAYGAGASTSSCGHLSFFSYRDPTPCRSHSTFLNSKKWLMSANVTQDMVDGAKLNVFQSCDAPVAPGYRNLSYFFGGLTDDMRQERRDRLFSVTKEDLLNACEQYLGDECFKSQSAATVIGPENEDSSKLKWPVVVFNN